MHTKIHKAFKLNGKSFENIAALITYSKEVSSDLTFFLEDLFSNSAIVIVTTSGSTGTPKEIEIKKEYLINSALATGAYFNLEAGTSALLCMSCKYIAGKMMVVRALVLGWSLDIVSPTSTPLSGIGKTYDFCAMVPLQVYASFNQLFQLKTLIIGGGVITKDLENKLQNIETHCYATFGMTETVTHIAARKLNGVGKSNVFETFPEVIVDRDERGCLIIEAPQVADDVLYTNDLVEVYSQEEFKWLGRYDNIINSGGIKLIPEQIEKSLEQLINRRFFVAGIPNDQLGNKLILVIEGAKDEKFELTIENSDVLNIYQKPKQLFFISKFEETETKKVQRQKTLEIVLKTLEE